MAYPHLGLREWPFRIVPEPEFCDFLADRATLRKDIAQLLASLENRPTSDIQLLWSWYGAGKTHTLYFLANQCTEKHERLFPFYTELPREAKGFVDLYRSTMSQIKVEAVIDAYLEFSTKPAAKTSFTTGFDPDLTSALTQAALGDRPIHVLLAQWLLGNPLAVAQHRELGVGMRVNTTEKCAAILADVITLLAPRPGVTGVESTLSKRVIWIIDEVQRVEDLPAAAQRSVLSGLVGVFNRCPTGLTMMLSYTGVPQEKVLPAWIPDDLKDRIGLERPMLLPPLGAADAALLIRELLAHFRSPDSPATGPYHPFEAEAIEALVAALLRAGDLKPRAIMETLDASLRVLEPEIRAGTRKSIDLPALKESLVRLSLDWTSQKSQQRRKDKK